MLLGGGFGLGRPSVLPLEALDASGRIDELHLAREEGVAVRADVEADVALVRGAGAERVAARAGNVHFKIGRMDFFFHQLLTERAPSSPSKTQE